MIPFECPSMYIIYILYRQMDKFCYYYNESHLHPKNSTHATTLTIELCQPTYYSSVFYRHSPVYSSKVSTASPLSLDDPQFIMLETRKKKTSNTST